MTSIAALSKDLNSYLEPQQVNQVVKAYHFANEAHEGQKRKSGEPYITHPLAVAKILAEMHMDHQCLMAALLHDVIEDTSIPKHTLGQEFDDEVAELVDGVSKLKIVFQSRAEAEAENFQKMTLAMAKDIRVILVKLADRLHNMRTLGYLNPEKRRRIAKETLEIYAPIALRLGMNNLRVEFEEIRFQAMYPLRSSMIEKAVKKARGNRTEIVDQIKESIENCLSRLKISGEVFGRQKHLFSIYEKMRNKRKSFSEIMDVYAFRIVVNEVDDCYRSLGAVHNLYKPVSARFKDYIAIPKANGYQSLHTTLFGMHGIPIEIQIRTHDMETFANNGLAGHYLYKTTDESPNKSGGRAIEWMKGLLEIQKNAGDSLEFIENVKVDLFPDDVYVFSPTGQIFDLPQGATPIDFAYAVHTDIGNACIACRIDRRLAPLSATLESGQTVEIIRAPGARPNPTWLNFIVTGKARAGIRNTLKQQQEVEATDLGKRLLEQTLRQYELTIDTLDKDVLQTILSERDISNFDDLLREIGLGNQMASLIASRLKGASGENPLFSETGGPLAIKGTEGMVVSYGKCCWPIPGDPIIGHLSAGKGIVIHIDACKNMADFLEKPQEIMEVRWASGVDQEFSVELRLELEHDRSMIAVLASAVTNANANIERINFLEKDAHLSIVNLVISVKDRIHLAAVIKKIRTIKGVNRILRARN